MQYILQAPDQYQVMLEKYSSVLEKTNQQLGLWYNPYGIAIGILAVLVAIIAIGVGYALWRNSKEQKDLFAQWLSEQEKIAKQNRDEAKEAFSSLIEEQKQKLTTAVGDQKEMIEKEIERLKKERAYISVSSSPSSSLLGLSATGPSGPGYAGYFSTLWDTKELICTHCGKKFKYTDDGPFSITLRSMEKTIFCTHCGKSNIIS